MEPAAHIEWGGLREILNDYPGVERVRDSVEKLVYDHVIKACIVMILLKRLELKTALILVLQHWKHLTLSVSVV